MNKAGRTANRWRWPRCNELQTPNSKDRMKSEHLKPNHWAVLPPGRGFCRHSFTLADRCVADPRLRAFFVMRYSLFILLPLLAAAEPLAVKSPDGQVALTVSLTSAGQPQWRVDYRGGSVLAESRLGLRLQDGTCLDRSLTISLGFLTPDKEYTAHVYADDDSAPTRTKVGIATRPVNSQTTLEVPLRAAGGQAVWITPATRAGQ
jgi:hypothetical protein